MCAIPGTVGGGVKMNAGAYGGDIASILVRAQVADADGAAWRSPEELGLSYRRSALEPGQVVAAAEFQGVTRPEAEIKEIVPPKMHAFGGVGHHVAAEAAPAGRPAPQGGHH